jgi:phosphonopyruvate decarboxylase
VSTTGKSSREVFEYRVRNLQNNNRDFLTVGSMGHCSQIALGIALNTNQKVFCLDGDGSLIMHMGSMGIVGKNAPNNFYHILLNNGSHESVGGQPTVGYDIDFPKIALSCGYNKAISVSSKSEFEVEIDNVLRYDGPVLLEIKVNKSSRDNLGRPSSTPIENKKALIDFIKTR